MKDEVLRRIALGRAVDAGLGLASAFEIGRRMWEATQNPLLVGLVAIAAFGVVYLSAEIVSTLAAYGTTPKSVASLQASVAGTVSEGKPKVSRPVSLAAAIRQAEEKE